MASMRRIHIFRAGLQTAMSGLQLNFSESDLAASAAAYDPALHEAPLVVGHPQADLPAYGWVKALSTDGVGLFAEPHQVNAEFAELVQAGAYKKVSAAFYTPDHPNNPAPGAYYLRHVGFLGAQPPAVKGLKGIEFAEDAQCVEVELEFSEVEDTLVWALGDLVPALRSLRESIVEKEGVEAADKALPSWRLDSMAEAATRAREALRKEQPQPSINPAFSESHHQETNTVTPEEKAALEAHNAQLLAERDAAVSALQAQAAQANTAAHIAFAEALVADGARISSADVQLIAATLDHLEPPVLAGSQAQVVEFGEGEAKKPMAEVLKTFLQSLPKRVEFSEQARRELAAKGQGEADGVQYAEGTPPESIDLDKRIRAYAKDNKVSYVEAANAVAAQR